MTFSIPPPTTYTGEEPLNREPRASTLISSFISSTEHAYDRNHGPIPQLCAETHKVHITGLVRESLVLSIASLSSDFSQHTVTSALQCAGNRRHTMRTAIKEVSGIDWRDAAVMNCQWTGPLLCDILKKAGVDSKKAKHVVFDCRSVAVQEDSYYGGSIPLDRALRPEAEVLLALKQNGKPLTPEHGFPVRVVVPGIAGARSVKWLDEIRVSEEESTNFYQKLDYKILPKEAVNKEVAEKFWLKTPALMDMPVNSVVACPEPDAQVQRDENGEIEAKGYALPAGEDGPIVKVEVRVDDGDWQPAEINHGGENGGKWCWCLWTWKGFVKPGKRTIWSRATDKGGNMQASERSEWNLRGVAYNGYGEVVVKIL